MTEPVVLYAKQGFQFKRMGDKQYSLDFWLFNPHLHLMSLMDFPFLKLIYDLNPDIYLTRDFQVHDESHATAVLLLKNFFEDLGLPQRFSHAHVERHLTEHGSVRFVSHTDFSSSTPAGIPPDAKLLPLERLECVCTQGSSPHEVHLECEVSFDQSMPVPPFAEKMIGMVLFKVFSRVKQFTEKMQP